MRPAVGVVALALVLSACGGSAAEQRPYRFVAERLVVLENGSIAVAGIAATGPLEDSGCRPGSESAWDFFVARVSPQGRLLRTDVITESSLDACGDLVIDARRGGEGRVDVIGWSVSPQEDETHGPVALTFGADGSRSHDFAAAQWLFDLGPYAFAETALPGGGSARMWSRGYGRPLQLAIERAGRPVVSVRSRALPADAQLYENWLYWYSLSAAADGLYGSGPYTRGEEGPYYFPIFRYGFDGLLDRRFGDDGVVLAHPRGVRFYVTTQVAADGQGRVLAVGGGDVGGRRITYVMRFLRDGRLDAGFGNAGVVRLPLGRDTDSNYADTRAAVGVLPGGRIAVAGGVQATGSTIWLLRPDGTIDRTFGRDGRLVLSPT